MGCNKRTFRFRIHDIIDIVVNHAHCDLKTIMKKYGLSDSCVKELQHKISSGQAEISVIPSKEAKK